MTAKPDDRHSHCKGNNEGIITVAIRSYIGSDTQVQGNLECKGDFLIEGAVQGNLRSAGSIVLGINAVVRGEVAAREVAVSGTVIGTIRCSARLEIYRSAQIVGAVHAPALKMESGAKVHARIIMSKPLARIAHESGSPDREDDRGSGVTIAGCGLQNAD